MRRLAGAFGRFGLLGLVSFAINLAVTAGLHEIAGLAEELAYAVALGVVLVTNFAACRLWVFPDSAGSVVGQGVAFLLSSFGFRGAEYVAFLLVHTLGGVHYLLTILLVTGVSTVVKFLHYRFLVFRTGRGPLPAGR
ncbi:MAG: hypothetical protein Kow0062_16700 [Acidobacteriota bacterium]